MVDLAPYIETEHFPRGRRVLLVPPAILLLVGPYGAMQSDDISSTLGWVVATLLVALGALVLGMGIAVPRRRFTADSSTQTLEVVQTAPVPKLGTVRVERPFSAVASTGIEMIGTRGQRDHGATPVITLSSGERFVLRRQRSSEAAQDVIDQLVLLGLPGQSRAAEREAQRSAPPSTTWL